MQQSIPVALIVALCSLSQTISSSNLTLIFQLNEEARAALCPFVGTEGMTCFHETSLRQGERKVQSEFLKLPCGVGISVDRATGQLMVPVIELTYASQGTRAWTDGHTGEIFDVFNEVSLGRGKRIARLHIFQNGSQVNSAWSQTFADGNVRGRELARRPDIIGYYDKHFSKNEGFALSQRVIGLYTLSIDASSIKLNKYARNALSLLTPTFDPELYEEFLNTWGTHIITKSLVGGMVEEQAKLIRCFDHFDYEKFIECTPFSDGSPISSDCKRYSDVIRIFAKRHLGGNPDMDDENQWKKTLAGEPALVQILEMVPWYSIVSDEAVKKNLAIMIKYRQRQIDGIQRESVRLVDSRLRSCSLEKPNIPCGARWENSGVTVAGGRGEGNNNNQLRKSYGIFIDNDETLIIADCFNHRIIQLKKGSTNGQIVAGTNSQGSGLNQLNHPSDVLIDKETDSLIIADLGNRRVMRWSRRNGTTQGEILIENVGSYGLALDDQRYLYVPDASKNEVRRYRLGEKNGTVVAGGNGQGANLNQLNLPTYLCVDQQQNIYISDRHNHRVVKWSKDAKEGIVVAGGHGTGSGLKQLYHPEGLFVDTLGNLYVADEHNHRIIRWDQVANEGTIIVGGNGIGGGANQLNYPMCLAFDQHGNLYVTDHQNNRVQRFSLIHRR